MIFVSWLTANSSQGLLQDSWIPDSPPNSVATPGQRSPSTRSSHRSNRRKWNSHHMDRRAWVRNSGQRIAVSTGGDCSRRYCRRHRPSHHTSWLGLGFPKRVLFLLLFFFFWVGCIVIGPGADTKSSVWCRSGKGTEVDWVSQGAKAIFRSDSYWQSHRRRPRVRLRFGYLA